jgi:hypothetical protein
MHSMFSYNFECIYDCMIKDIYQLKHGSDLVKT